MNTINVENCKTLLIGRRGENEVTTVAFDFTEWASEFGSGVVDLYVKRFGDDSAYPVVLTVDGTVASWLVTETDTNVAGYGKAEYVYRVDGKIAKSAVFPFFVAEDIGQPASEPPDPYESWLEQLTALGAETEAHAQAAEQSAENAAESAQEAAGSATSAESYAGQAETAAGLAQAAQTASEAARDAAQTAQASAEASATAASGSAASAAGSATAAAGSASDASASATAAGASASAASASATTASNAATAAQTAQSAAEDAAEDAQQAAQQAHVEYEQLSGEVDDLSDEVSQQKSAIDDLSALVDRKAGMLVDTASGAIASFTPDATIPNLLGVSVDIEPVQDLHGFDHPWPAGGGENVWGSTKLATDISSAIIATINTTKKTVSFNPQAVSGADGQELTTGITFAENTQYTFILNGSVSNRANLMFTYTDGTTDRSLGRTIAVGANVSMNGKTVKALAFRSYSGDTVINYELSGLFKGTLTESQFSPYSNICPISGWDAVEVNHSGADTSDPTTYTITIGDTVYGGTLDVTNGTLTVDREKIVFASSSGWASNGNAGMYYNNFVVNAHVNPDGQIIANYLVSLTPGAGSGLQNWQCRINASLTNLLVKADGVVDADLTAWNNFLAANPLEIVCELATPITITLDPVTISTISGQTNNVWADAGDVDVTYAADIKAYIDNKIAAAVAAMS